MRVERNLALPRETVTTFQLLVTTMTTTSQHTTSTTPTPPTHLGASSSLQDSFTFSNRTTGVNLQQTQPKSTATTSTTRIRPEEVLQWLDPASNPLLPTTIYQPKSAHPIAVIYVGLENRAHADKSNITIDPVNDENLVFLDALQRSRYTRLESMYWISSRNGDSSPSIRHQHFVYEDSKDESKLVPRVMVIDWSLSRRRDCHLLQQLFVREEHSIPTVDAVLMLDATSASARTVLCPEIPASRIRVAQRSVVHGRHWNRTKQWIEPGTVTTTEDSNTAAHHYSNVLHMPGYVSELYWQQVRPLLEAAGDLSKPDADRPLDVVHYCQSSENIETSLYYTQLRQRVTWQLNQTQALLALENKMSTAKFVDRVGMADEGVDVLIELDLMISGSESADGSTSIISTADKEYDQSASGPASVNVNPEMAVTTLHIALLASSKIVVVTQNDEWEDHDNRFMEAMASGALVMMDRMVAPPAGLKDRTNVVWFDTPQELDRLIRYYLNEPEKRQAVARHGMQWALGRHRPWHVLELLLFGKALTQTDHVFDGEIGPPPKRALARLQQSLNNNSSSITYSYNAAGIRRPSRLE